LTGIMRDPGAKEGSDRDWRPSESVSERGEDQRCQFRLFQADRASLTSTQFDGGDWRWQFCSPSGEIIIESTGYVSEAQCWASVLRLQNEAAYASILTLG
jgi:uncharacterized protein YegP (UPF0339 family)